MFIILYIYIYIFMKVFREVVKNKHVINTFQVKLVKIYNADCDTLNKKQQKIPGNGHENKSVRSM